MPTSMDSLFPFPLFTSPNPFILARNFYLSKKLRTSSTLPSSSTAPCLRTWPPRILRPLAAAADSPGYILRTGPAVADIHLADTLLDCTACLDSGSIRLAALAVDRPEKGNRPAGTAKSCSSLRRPRPGRVRVAERRRCLGGCHRQGVGGCRCTSGLTLRFGECEMRNVVVDGSCYG